MSVLVLFRKDRGKGEPIGVFCSVTCRQNYAVEALGGIRLSLIGFGEDPDEHHRGDSCTWCEAPISIEAAQ